MAKILVVDDSMLSRNIASDALTKAGFEVVEANNGQDGLKMFDKHQPDCVVMDLLMPVMCGQEFLRCLREKGVDVPVFVLTSDIQQASKSECEALGISGFLHKPVLGSQLVTCVQEELAKTKRAMA